MRELRQAGKAEWTIAGVVKAANRTFKFAKRRMNWHGQNPVLELENGERPKVSAAARRPIFVGDQLAQTLAAARDPYKTLFAVGSVTGARMSECLGLVWTDMQLDDLDAATIRFEYQVDRHGRRQPLKTKESRRTVEIPRQLAVILVAHKLRSRDTSPTAFVFATRTGAAINQRDVGTALRRARNAPLTIMDGRRFPPCMSATSVAARCPCRVAWCRASTASVTRRQALRSPLASPPRRSPGSLDTRTVSSRELSTCRRSRARSAPRADAPGWRSVMEASWKRQTAAERPKRPIARPLKCPICRANAPALSRP